jgi:hypothetical protein
MQRQSAHSPRVCCRCEEGLVIGVVSPTVTRATSGHPTALRDKGVSPRGAGRSAWSKAPIASTLRAKIMICLIAWWALTSAIRQHRSIAQPRRTRAHSRLQAWCRLLKKTSSVIWLWTARLLHKLVFTWVLAGGHHNYKAVQLKTSAGGPCLYWKSAHAEFAFLLCKQTQSLTLLGFHVPGRCAKPVRITTGATPRPFGITRSHSFNVNNTSRDNPAGGGAFGSQRKPGKPV